MTNKRAWTAISLAGLLVSASAQADSYDATADFQTLSNPGSVWSYGYSPSAGAGYAMTLFDATSAAGWFMGNYNSLGTPAAFMNLGAPANGVATGQLALHAGPAVFGDLAILRFTAPAAGDYTVSGQFFAGDVGSESGMIILNDDADHPLQSFSDTTDASIFAPLTLSLAAGAHLDFVVGNNGNYLNGSTPLSVQVNAVPEPSNSLFLLSGLGVVAYVSGRRRAG